MEARHALARGPPHALVRAPQRTRPRDSRRTARRTPRYKRGMMSVTRINVDKDKDVASRSSAPSLLPRHIIGG